jgi:LPS-assembly protein
MAGMQWDWERSELSVGTLGFDYRGKKGERFRFEYRYRRDRVDQFDLRIFWPINERWRVLSRLNYSFADSDLLEIQGGVEYESCCWAIRTVLRRYLKNREGDYRDGIYFELNLKGLASVGTQSNRLFYD